jgi:type IV secretory pathway VirB4 component
MLNLAEYRQRPALLADWLPWAGLVAPGVVLNKDGSFQRTARFRGPDLDSATQGELIATSARLNNALRRMGSGWALFIEAERRPPPTIRTRSFPSRCRGWWTRNAAPPSRNRATTSRAAIT